MTTRDLPSRAVVSGITGQLGRELARQLAAPGLEVHGLTRQGSAVDLGLSAAVVFHPLDGSTETLIDLFKVIQPRTVFHLAALARRDHLSSDVAPFVEANVLLGTQLLEASRISGCHRFITAGSNLQFSDAGEYRALNLYAATKQAFEDLLAYFADAFEIAAVRLALPTLYGESETRPKLMTDLAAACIQGSPVSLNTHSVDLDLVHLEDAAAAFIRADSLLETRYAPKGALTRYSVCSGADVTPGQLLALFERVSERPLVVEHTETQRASRRARPWRGTVVPGWTPRITLEDGIRRILTRLH